jgi:drug/metabolite transporter (DMT)-like permease
MRIRTRELALTEGMAAGILFGTAAIFIRFLQGLDAFSIAFWRIIIACLALTATLIVAKRPFSLVLIRKNAKELFILSFFLGLHFIFFVSAVKDTTILNATVLVNTSPIFSMLVSSFLFKLKPSRLTLAGLTVSFIGVCIIAYAETITSGTGVQSKAFSSSLIGDLEAVLAAVVEAFYLNYGRKLRSEMSILTAVLPMYVLTAVVIGVIGLPVTQRIPALPSRPEFILPLLGLGILPTAIAHTLYFSSLSNLKSFETATMALIEPIGATFLGMALFQEIPAPLFGVGAALTLMGILFVVKQKLQAPREK